MPAREHHKSHKTGWLRAAVLGANDGIVSTASLIVGVASSNASDRSILVAGVAGLVAGAMSMAAGEYVSVSSQRDAEQADLKMEKREIERNPEIEKLELTNIYVERGLEPDLAEQVAEQLTAKNALEAHARDELGFSESSIARPLQAAFASAASFSVGAALPLAAAILSPHTIINWVVSIASLISLAILGAAAANAGGANMVRGALRVTFWSAVAMAATAFIGSLFGTNV